jgi:hypothetical protein
VIQTLRADKHELGCIAEERVLGGALAYESSMQRLEAEEERFVLLAMHQTLVERGLCSREQTETGTLLIFPSYYGRERPELEGHPAVLVSYRFAGFLDDIYATLVVRLHHTKPVPARPTVALCRRLQDADRQTTGSEDDAAVRRRGRAGGVISIRASRSRRRSSSAGMFTSTCCKRARMSCGCGTTCARTAALRWATGKWR